MRCGGTLRLVAWSDYVDDLILCSGNRSDPEDAGKSRTISPPLHIISRWLGTSRHLQPTRSAGNQREV